MTQEEHRLIVGSRGSRLALWQTNHVVELLRCAFPDLDVQIRIFTTEGDDDTTTSLPEIGGAGVFTSRLERALAANEIDFAVHSLKDLPVDLESGMTIAAVTSRADVRDCLVARNGWTLATLPPGAVVGTSSLRRQAQLLARREDLAVKAIRGNVETRIRKVADAEFDAALLAAAGIVRLGLEASVTEWIPVDVIFPAPGQGALALECRAGDGRVLGRLAAIDEPATRVAVDAERGFLKHLGGGCSAPIAAYAYLHDSCVHLTGVVGSPDGSQVVRVHGESNDGDALARQLATQALAGGAAEIVATFRTMNNLPVANSGLEGRRVVVTRPREQAEALCTRLAGMGAIPICASAIRIDPVEDLHPLDDAIARLHTFDWVLFTSSSAVDIFLQRCQRAELASRPIEAARVAAIGPATADTLRSSGVQVDFVPGDYTGDALAESLPIELGARVLLPRAVDGRRETAEILRRRGAAVVDLAVYRTVAEEIDDTVAFEIERGVDAVLFTSGSTVRHFMEAVRRRNPRFEFDRRARVACIGPVTAAEARALGVRVDIVAKNGTEDSLIQALAESFSKEGVTHE